MTRVLEAPAASLKDPVPFAADNMYGLQLPRQRVGYCGVVRPVRNLRQLPAILKVERKIRFGQKIPRRHPERPLIVRQIEGNHRDGLVRRRAAARFWGGILQNRRREI